MTSPSKELKRDHQTAFRPIGDIAAAADALKGDEDAEQMQVEDGQQSKELKTSNDEELDHPVESIESLCMQCGENGTTRLLLTMIPYFKEVIIMSFRCPHCGFNNNEIQPAGSIQPLGSVYTVKCTIRDDLNRQLVKSQFATLQIPEYELTLPPGKGQLTTIESIITHTIEDLEFEQPVRQHTLPELHAKIEDILNKLRPIVADSMGDDKDKLEKTFTVKLDDLSGNSFIEAKGGFDDPKWSKREYKRTPEQNETLGLEGKADEGTAVSSDVAQNGASAAVPKAGLTVNAANEKTLTDDYVDKPEDVYSFPDICSSCGAHLETFMKTVDIPHFKEVVLMSTNCHSCGYRDNEIKSGGAIAPNGRKITLKVEDTEDLTRDILKSETAGLTIPEIDLHLQPGTLGGRFTTLEGLLNQVYEELDERAFAKGDAAVRDGASEIELFLSKLKQVREVLMPYTIILDDPLNNSYIQNLYAPDDDPNMQVEVYERSYEQNEDLGLNDIKVEGYEGEEEARKAREEDDARNAAAAAAAAERASS
ncbi:zf-ZPR1-domain-containing protein [Cystobasidium minutum MCA 4210]|uniref:zf-ZPR1-domain-containing protein n=1 Tax=Cystobasidium minutum MCA 4210 TaxID=1397322 RepID=UPI0034D01287|eukprot:jgi/Rhomi1/3684/CE3683_6584